MAGYFFRFDDQAHKAIAQTTPLIMGSIRHDIVTTGGNAIMDPEVRIADIPTLIRYVPRALLIGFLAPLPGQLFDTHGTTGGM